MISFGSSIKNHGREKGGPLAEQEKNLNLAFAF